MNKEIFSAINQIPYLGIIIYQDKIIYANDTVVNLTGYTLEELKKLSILDLIPSQFHEKAKKVISKRLLGEHFYNYFELPIIKKDGSQIICLIFSSTIKYQNKYSGFIIAIDISKQKFLENAYFLIAEINKLSNQCDNEDDFFQLLCKHLKKIYGEDYVCFGKFDKDKKVLSPHCGIGDPIPLKCLGNEKEVENTFKLDKILIGKTQPNLPECKNLSQKNIVSHTAIPIRKDDKIEYFLTIFSSVNTSIKKNEELSLFKNLKKTIESSIDKLEKDKTVKILYNALENSPDWVLITDKYGTIIYANKTVEKLSGYTKEELIGNNPRILKSGYYGKDFYNKMWSTLYRGEPFNCVIINKNKFGKLFKVEHLIIPVKIGNKISYFVAIGKDLSREEKLEGEVYKLKFHDVLTGVLNRYGFIFEVNNRIKTLSSQELGLLVVLDIYNFSYINKIFSDKVGDEIITEVGKLLESIIPNGIIGRTGGDEFTIFLPIKENEIVEFLESLIEIFKISKFSSKYLTIGINIGASIYPKDSEGINELINNARSSLNISKEKGENKYEIFNKEIEEKIKKDRTTRELIIKSLENDWFEIYLQPYFFIKNRKLAGFEALLRINHPEKGILTPYHFINVLEESEFIFEVEKKIIKKLQDIIIYWKNKKYKIKPISLNLTGKSFKNPNVISFLEKTVKEIGQNYINLEITERLLLEDPEYSKNVINKLKKLGIKCSLDDFGTGYSSLSYLTEIPVDFIKIDISFIRKFLDDSKSHIIVETIITLSKKLNIKTIAEGVETELQLEELTKLGCDMAQGYLLGKPSPISEAEKFLL